jgi:hypothetical protein
MVNTIDRKAILNKENYLEKSQQIFSLPLLYAIIIIAFVKQREITIFKENI